MKYCLAEIEKDRSFRFDHVHILFNEQITMHQGPEWELSYVITGSGTRITGNTTAFFRSGEVVLLPPNMPHGWYFDEFDHDNDGKIENVTLFFTTEFLHKIVSTFPESSTFIKSILEMKEAVRFDGQTLSAIQQLMTAMISQNDMERLTTLLQLILRIGSTNETVVVGTNPKQNKSNVRMQDLSRFIVNNFQRKITLEEVASYVGMNKTSFCSFYKKMKGKTFFADLNDFRINSSCMMLKETSLPITDICYAAGFDDVPYFNRSFKKKKGLSPMDYRKMHRDESSGPTNSQTSS